MTIEQHGSEGWDPVAAKRLAEESFGAVDCTHAGVGLEQAMASQGWHVTGTRLWWRQDYSPSSHIEFLITAEWVGDGPPSAPWLKAITYEPSGQLHNVDDLSPWDEYDLPRVIPRALEYSSTIHLRGAGPSSVPGKIVFKPAIAPEPQVDAPASGEEFVIEDETY